MKIHLASHQVIFCAVYCLVFLIMKCSQVDFGVSFSCFWSPAQWILQSRIVCFEVHPTWCTVCVRGSCRQLLVSPSFSPRVCRPQSFHTSTPTSYTPLQEATDTPSIYHSKSPLVPPPPSPQAGVDPLTCHQSEHLSFSLLLYDLCLGLSCPLRLTHFSTCYCSLRLSVCVRVCVCVKWVICCQLITGYCLLQTKQKQII